jgi:hypothetical protein
MKITDVQVFRACSASQIFSWIGTLTGTGVYGVVRSRWGSIRG